MTGNDSHLSHSLPCTASLRKLSKRGFTSYADEPRPIWVLHQPAQLVIAVSQIYWCAAVEDRLRGSEPTQGLQDFLFVSHPLS